MPARWSRSARRDRLDLIYLELARSKHGAMLRLMQGSRLPITTTAMGRALIAGDAGGRARTGCSATSSARKARTGRR